MCNFGLYRWKSAFISLIDKHFSKKHKLHKILKQNNVKISSSCMPNIESLVSRIINFYMETRNEKHQDLAIA